jgi:hypothetical protein
MPEVPFYGSHKVLIQPVRSDNTQTPVITTLFSYNNSIL